MNKNYSFIREGSEKLNLLINETHASCEWRRFAFLLKLVQVLEIGMLTQLFCSSYPPFKIKFKLFSNDIKHLSLFY